MKPIPVGAKAEQDLLVTAEVSFDFLGMDQARILSTPHMIGWLELTARNALLPYLEKGEDSVGTVVNIRHLAATPIGMQVRFSAEVTGIEGRRVQFRVEARDEQELVGEGVHERFVIDVARFATKLAAKAQA
jgi:predicted thioesterase